MKLQFLTTNWGVDEANRARTVIRDLVSDLCHFTTLSLTYVFSDARVPQGYAEDGKPSRCAATKRE